MGSNIQDAPGALPSASSSSLILAQPTQQERQRTWSLTHPMWGPALSHDEYLRREAYMMTIPLARNGGITHWILTTATGEPDARPVLSSCESIRKHALVTQPGEDDIENVIDGVVHGIGSVFTDPRYRGKGYAGRMLEELGHRLRTWQAETVFGKADGEARKKRPKQCLFSLLYSDIGKTFYAKKGWAPMPSTHVSFPPILASQSEHDSVGDRACKVYPLGYHELAELCAVDEARLRADLSLRARRGTTTRHVALVPDLDAMLWHLMREDFMTKHIFGRTPDVRGGLWTAPGSGGGRVWAVWTRGYYGGIDKLEGNTLHILRLVPEEGLDEQEVAEGLLGIVRLAQGEAAKWKASDIQLWNPEERVRKALDRGGLEYVYVDRDKDSIASLMWYGEGDSKDLDWVINEKYGWC